jgi:hypothetical protein
MVWESSRGHFTVSVPLISGADVENRPEGAS